VTLNRSFDATTLREVQTAAANEGVDVSLTDLLVRGVGMELADRPAFNALFEDGTHKLIEEVNIGIAVDIEEGLVTPVVPSVAEKSVEEIAAVRRERTQRALNGEFEMSDMEGGTFTITNLGMFDIDSFDPIINPPEVAILGVGRIQDDGAMILSLSFDHRVVNGADAARFLDGTVGNLTDAKWLADQFDENIFGALIEHLSE
jgi:pyruvate dehydrogenase E2 component (dihydrolipoamide acetyltransferase)